MMDYVASLENRVRESQFIFELRPGKSPLTFADMLKHFSGMPGYVHTEKEE